MTRSWGGHRRHRIILPPVVCSKKKKYICYVGISNITLDMYAIYVCVCCISVGFRPIDLYTD